MKIDPVLYYLFATAGCMPTGFKKHFHTFYLLLLTSSTVLLVSNRR
jgi:hypothetical protein